MLARAPAGRCARPREEATCSSAASTAVQAGYRVLLDLCLRFRFARVPDLPRHRRGDRLAVRDDPEGLLPDTRTSASSRSRPRRARTSRSRRWWTCSAKVGDDPRALAACRACRELASARPASAGTLNAGRVLRRAEAEGPAPRAADRCSPTCAASSSPGARHLSASCTPVQNLRLGGRASKSQYQFVLQGLNQDRARPLGGAAVGRHGPRRPRPSPTSPTDLQNTALQATLMIDRDKARALGITADQLRSTLYTGFGARQVSTIYATGDSYQVIVEFDPRLALDRRTGSTSRAHPRRQRQAGAARPPSPGRAHGRAAHRSTSSASCRR